MWTFKNTEKVKKIPKISGFWYGVFQICKIPLLNIFTGHAKCCHFPPQGALTYICTAKDGKTEKGGILKI
jgi:hypothetical protein